ncbi:methoxy mycolic acid synthase [Stachybotrys elegans]|uniref:Methoxy mycolic acid synthase n=1 Tax=Stachybotrys elegans TaxID=80388 RepID=A0A8K0SUX5_9HYPO|nr:methoxy mycolic acid synthase [Stachybotrys elegans]
METSPLKSPGNQPNATFWLPYNVLTLGHLRTKLLSLVIDHTQSFVLAALGRVRLGEITIKHNDTVQTFGSSGRQRATLTIRSDNVWWRVALNSTIGFSESYMLGEIDCSNLETFLEIMILNREKTSDLASAASIVLSRAAGWMRPSNDPAVALSNVRSHYDLSNDAFSAFLSPDMTYSCPIWLPKSDANATESLEKAQLRKLHEVIDQAKIKQTDHVLEIGTGWGSFAIAAARSTGCRVTSLTLSAEQKAEAEKRIRAAGLQDKITVLLQDYRSLSGAGQRFDKCVSLEMLEHVGKDHLATYFAIIDEVLKRDGGIVVLQSSTMPETRYKAYNEGDDFIRKYIFPGAHLPTTTKIIEAAHAGSNGSFVPEKLINLGGHYSKCLRTWRENFMTNFDSQIAPAMMARNEGILPLEMEQFKRKFVFYFAMCEAGFKTKTLGNALITFAREGAIETLDDIEL